MLLVPCVLLLLLLTVFPVPVMERAFSLVVLSLPFLCKSRRASTKYMEPEIDIDL